ncbi:MAG: hypothetical protein Q8Q88_23940 [Phenylobacterium sp.]|uniref:hypothetical protein n=1 Tax=Phenylobacterium sp. TaxID=1871053 RepID=UPI00273335D4|nr:hypothetical protein [Phenylobacterium sp.]MDP3750088.1 hypothetical protein [Phenylobacterium sp.]
MSRQTAHAHHVTHAARGQAVSREADRLAAYFTQRLGDLWDDDAWRRGILGGPWLPSRLSSPELRFWTMVRDLVMVVESMNCETVFQLDFEPVRSGFVEILKQGFEPRRIRVRFEPRLLALGSEFVDLGSRRAGEETLDALSRAVAREVARPWEEGDG